MVKYLSHFRPVERPIVLHPAPNDRIDRSGYRFQVVSVLRASLHSCMVSRIALWALLLTAGAKLTKYLPALFIDSLGRNP
jgi:hypothetical protein